MPPEMLLIIEVDSALAAAGSGIDPSHETIDQTSLPRGAVLQASGDTLGVRLVIQVLIQGPVPCSLSPERATDSPGSGSKSFPGEELIKGHNPASTDADTVVVHEFPAD
jgi:hypothetical protein